MAEPRRILVDCPRLRRFSGPGVETLVTLAQDQRDGDTRAVVLAPPKPAPPKPDKDAPESSNQKPPPPPEPVLGDALGNRVPTFNNWDEAVGALGEVPKELRQPLTVPVRRGS